MRKICVVTGSRAEYGLLSGLMRVIQEDKELQLQVIATNMHLSPEFGLTYREIEKDGSYIFVLRNDNIVERRFIELGPETGNKVVVERGLLPGEQIVVEGYHKLQHGMKARRADSLQKAE